MSARKLSLAVALGVVLIGVLSAPRPAAARKWFDPAAIYQVPTGASPSRGPADAMVTIVEFSDYNCKYCNRVQRTLEHVERLHGGKIRWVYRHLPLDADDTLVAEAGLAAAAQGMFWPMHDRLFAVHGMVDRAGVELIAADLGLDMTRFRGELDARTWRSVVMADADDAATLGVTGTPTFFVNGRPLRGAQPLGVFLRVLDEELDRAEAALDGGTIAAELYGALTAAGHAGANVDVEEDYAPPRLDPDGTYQVGLGLDGHADGPADALVTVVAWSDFQCGYCASNAPNLTRLRREYAGTVRIVYRHMPLPFHGNAQLAAEASVAAAAQGKFWAMHDAMFADLEHLERADLEAMASRIGLDLGEFRAALDEHRHRDAVADDIAAGAALGINGTPTLFINGAPIEGAPQWDQLKLAVELQLAAAESMVARGVAAADVYGVIMAAADGAERGDPSRMPRTTSGARVELLQDDREAAVEAACRGRDAERAGGMAGRLKGASRDAARATCEAYGIDLP